MALQATREESATLIDVVEKILDKGLVINADICVSVAGVELLGIKIRAALASFETAAKYGLEFPSARTLPPRSGKKPWKITIPARSARKRSRTTNCSTNVVPGAAGQREGIEQQSEVSEDPELPVGQDHGSYPGTPGNTR